MITVYILIEDAKEGRKIRCVSSRRYLILKFWKEIAEGEKDPEMFIEKWEIEV